MDMLEENLQRNIDVQSTSKERSRSVWTQHLNAAYVLHNDFNFHIGRSMTIIDESINIKSTKQKVG